IAVDERSRRSPCRLHNGTNPTAFSWTEDGLWHCFSCGRSGDKFGLVQAALNCDFREALRVMAVVAGVELKRVSPAQRRRIRAQQSKERRLDIAAERYAILGRRLFLECASRVRLLDRLENLASYCLQDAKSVDSVEFWWDALSGIYCEGWQALAAWLLVG